MDAGVIALAATEANLGNHPADAKWPRWQIEFTRTALSSASRLTPTLTGEASSGLYTLPRPSSKTLDPICNLAWTGHAGRAAFKGRIDGLSHRFVNSRCSTMAA